MVSKIQDNPGQYAFKFYVRKLEKEKINWRISYWVVYCFLFTFETMALFQAKQVSSLSTFFSISLWCEIFGFFSSCSLKTREKCISVAQFVYFLREVCLLFNFWMIKFTIMSKKLNWLNKLELRNIIQMEHIRLLMMYCLLLCPY